MNLKEYQFLFPDNNIYTKTLSPDTTIESVHKSLWDLMFNENGYLFGTAKQKILFFYRGIFLPPNFKFSQINYTDNTPIRVYIKATRDFQQFDMQKLSQIEFYAPTIDYDYAQERMSFYENEFTTFVTREEEAQLNKILPKEFPSTLNMQIFLQFGRDFEKLKGYFEHAFD